MSDEERPVKQRRYMRWTPDHVARFIEKTFAQSALAVLIATILALLKRIREVNQELLARLEPSRRKKERHAQPRGQVARRELRVPQRPQDGRAALTGILVASVWIPDQARGQRVVEVRFDRARRARDARRLAGAVPARGDQLGAALDVALELGELLDPLAELPIQILKQGHNLVARFLARATHGARQRDLLDALHAKAALRECQDDAGTLDVVL